MEEIVIKSLQHQVETLDYEMLDLLRRRWQIQQELQKRDAHISLELALEYMYQEIENQCLDPEKIEKMWKEIYK